jgi:hypothetical protein
VFPAPNFLIMPAGIQKQGNVWRVIEKTSSKPVKSDAGTDVDGGGHATRGDALAQAAAINNKKQRKGRFS